MMLTESTAHLSLAAGLGVLFLRGALRDAMPGAQQCLCEHLMISGFGLPCPDQCVQVTGLGSILK